MSPATEHEHAGVARAEDRHGRRVAAAGLDRVDDGAAALGARRQRQHVDDLDATTGFPPQGFVLRRAPEPASSDADAPPLRPGTAGSPSLTGAM